MKERDGMAIQRVFSRNAAFQKFEVLMTNRNKRCKYGQFWVEGVRNINEAIRYGWQVDSFLFAHESRLSAWAAGCLDHVKTRVNYALADFLMAELSGKEDTSELMAIVQMKEETENTLSDNPLILLFDRPSNRGNLGAVIRSCDALGADELMITGHAVDPYDPEVIRASMGSFFKLPFRRLSDHAGIDAYIAGLRLRYPTLQVIGTTAHHQHPLEAADLTTPVMFLVGNETEGLNRYLYERCDNLVTIPMAADASASSLNVGCAATVMLYEAGRQRRLRARPVRPFKGGTGPPLRNPPLEVY